MMDEKRFFSSEESTPLLLDIESQSQDIIYPCISSKRPSRMETIHQFWRDLYQNIPIPNFGYAYQRVVSTHLSPLSLPLTSFTDFFSSDNTYTACIHQGGIRWLSRTFNSPQPGLSSLSAGNPTSQSAGNPTSQSAGNPASLKVGKPKNLPTGRYKPSSCCWFYWLTLLILSSSKTRERHLLLVNPGLKLHCSASQSRLIVSIRNLTQSLSDW